MKMFNKIQYIALFAISLLLIGLTSVITGGMGFDTFRDVTFYVQMGLTYAAIICIIAGTILMVIDKFIASDDEYIACENDIKTFAKDTYVPSTFSKYCEHVNKTRKLRQHVANVRAKLHHLENAATETDIYEWNNNKEAAIKAKNKYCLLRANLELQLTDAWIADNIANHIVKYDRITANVILAGHFTKRDNYSANDFITKNQAARVIRDKLPMLLISFGMMSIVSAMVVDFLFTPSALLTFFTKMLSLIFNTFMSIRYANNFTQTVTLKDIRFRKGVIKEYNLWIVQTAKETVKEETQADKLFAEIQQEAAQRPVEVKGLTAIINATPIGTIKNIVEAIKEDNNNEC